MQNNSADLTWSDEANKLRLIRQQFYSKHKRTPEGAYASLISYQPFSKSFLVSFFKTLRLNDMNIEHVDLEIVSNLRELVLIGNEIKALHTRNIPSSLEALNISVNRQIHLEAIVTRSYADILLQLGLLVHQICQACKI